MKSVSQNLSQQTRRFIRFKIRQELQPGLVMALVESEMHSVLAESLNQSLLLEQSDLLGRDQHERLEADTPYRNGYKAFRLKGIFSSVMLRRPVLRGTTPPSPFLESLKRTGKNLAGVLASRFWLRGASTRAVAQELNAAFGTRLRSADVSVLTNKLLPEAHAWLNRPITQEIAYLFLDAIYLPVRVSKFTAKQAILVAIGVTPAGKRHVLGFLLGDRESEDSWSALIKELKARGLDSSKIRLAISDDHKAIGAAVSKLLAVPHQLCVVHKMRNVRVRIAGKDQKAFLADFKKIFWAPNREEAYIALGQLQSRWQKAYPKAVELTCADPERFLAFMAEDKAIWTTLRSSNLIERFNRELRRRLRPAGAMQAEGEVWKLVWSVSTEHERRWETKRVRGAKHLSAAL
jgi:transposase-like protein